MMPIPANPSNASIQPQLLYDAWSNVASLAMLTEVYLYLTVGVGGRQHRDAHYTQLCGCLHCFAVRTGS